MTNDSGVKEDWVLKKNMYIPIVQGMAVTAIFLLTEIVLNLLGAFDGDIQLYLVDIPIRLVFGTIALILLAFSFKKQRSKFSLKELFTNAIPKSAYKLLLPFVLFLIIELLTMITAEEISMKALGIFGLNSVQQLTTGYFEEASRALLMCGLLKYNIGTKKNRLYTIFIAGICFGLSHMLNFFFGNDILSTLWQVFSCFVWGLFVASIYMLSENLTLIMLMHALWDIIIRVPDAFCRLPENSILLDGMYIIQDIIQFGIMTAASVYICIKYDKLR